MALPAISHVGQAQDRRISVQLDALVKLCDRYEHGGGNVDGARMAALKTILTYCRDETEANLTTLAGTL